MEYFIGLKPHIGVRAAPIVGIGERVAKGQLIAVCDGLGANIHASVYGVITGICENSVKIAADAIQPEEFVAIRETASNLEAIREAGIVGAGGAGFPTHVKFGADLKGGNFILNAAECEPILAHNLRVLAEQPELILRGMKYAMEIINAKKGYIAVKTKNAKHILGLAKACAAEPDIEIKFLPNIYPVGDERVIIRELFGVILNPGQLPTEAGAIVSNVETIKRVAEAIELRKPVITKDFTIGDGRVYLDEPIGSPITKYIDGGEGEIVLGGPFTGVRASADSAISKTLGGIFAAAPFERAEKKFGILACECGAEEARLREIVAGMGGEVVAEA
ncbi:MAG: proline reductase-associated electron transfer protein PrdC, partial [Clostridiales bacterium]|nr:proline reductase-associated electron transfer protein PrdC [Clostridiales bacterium]